MTKPTYIVICRADRRPDGTPGAHELATRRVFASREDADSYAAGISTSRDPMVIAGRFDELRDVPVRDDANTEIARLRALLAETRPLLERLGDFVGNGNAYDRCVLLLKIAAALHPEDYPGDTLEKAIAYVRLEGTPQ